MPNEVMDCVRNLGRQAHANVGLIFTDCNGDPLPNAYDNNAASNSNDETYDPNNDSNESDDDDYHSNVENPPIAGVDDDNVEVLSINNNNII
jgi:hypothetical protein